MFRGKCQAAQVASLVFASAKPRVGGLFAKLILNTMSEVVPSLAVATQRSSTCSPKILSVSTRLAEPCFFMLSIQVPVLATILQYGLCLKSYSSVARVSRLFSLQSKCPSSWTGSVIDITTVCVPHDRIRHCIRLWSCAASVVFNFPNLAFVQSLTLPSTLRSQWFGGDNHWNRIHLYFDVHMCIMFSRWPILSDDVIRVNVRPRSQYSAGTSEFSIGFCTATSPRQLARVITGDGMTAKDEDIHVCLLHFPSMCRHGWHSLHHLNLEHFQGPPPGGFSQERSVDLISPFPFNDSCSLGIGIDVQSNHILINLSNSIEMQVPAFFIESAAPPLCRDSLHQWSYFIAAEGFDPPDLEFSFIDSKCNFFNQQVDQQY